MPPPAVEAEIEALFRRHHGALLRTAQMLVDDRGSAEEIVQEAFVRLFRSWDRLREPEAAVGYLRTTVLNLARTGLRRRLLARTRHFRPDGAGASPAEHAIVGDEHRAVLAAVRTLPGRQRECIVLRYYHDLSEAEIADTLGISAGSVKTHVHRAMAALGQALEDGR